MTGEIFDCVARDIEAGETERAVSQLDRAFNFLFTPESRALLRNHAVYGYLMQDPYLVCDAHPIERDESPAWLDYAYDRVLPSQVSDLGARLFSSTTALPFSSAIRSRRADMAKILKRAFIERRRICVLDCGNFREGDILIGRDLTTVTLVDRDSRFGGTIRSNHGSTVVFETKDPLDYLRECASHGEKFDIIYTLGAAGAKNRWNLQAIVFAAGRCLRSDGSIVFAILAPTPEFVAWTSLARLKRDVVDRQENTFRAEIITACKAANIEVLELNRCARRLQYFEVRPFPKATRFLEILR